MTSSQIQSDARRYDAVWGDISGLANGAAGYAQLWNAGHPGMIVSRYFLYTEDQNYVSRHDLAWFRQNHPDWILYACHSDGDTNPTDLAYNNGEGFPDVPLDFSNPAVIDYQLNTIMIPFMQAHGYNALAADNVDLQNIMAGPNPTLGQGHPSKPPAEFGCGVYQNGQFVHKFSGPYGAADPRYIAATMQWMKTAHGMLAQHGMKLLINHQFFGLNQNEESLIQNIDGVVDENGFANRGRYNSVRSALTLMTYGQQHGVAVFITNYFNEPSGSLTPSEVDYGIATYMLGNDGGADVFNSPAGGNSEYFRDEYGTTRYGTPCGPYTTSGSIYFRRFSGGMAIANASASPQTFTLPATHSYTDMEGRPVSNPLMVNGNDGYVLLTSANGCT